MSTLSSSIFIPHYTDTYSYIRFRSQILTWYPVQRYFVSNRYTRTVMHYCLLVLFSEQQTQQAVLKITVSFMAYPVTTICIPTSHSAQIFQYTNMKNEVWWDLLWVLFQLSNTWNLNCFLEMPVIYLIFITIDNNLPSKQVRETHSRHIHPRKINCRSNIIFI